MKITIHGYSPSKKSRAAIIKNLMKQLESSPDREIAESKERSRKAPGKKRRGLEKESKLEPFPLDMGHYAYPACRK
jgi:hypothetical protein